MISLDAPKHSLKTNAWINNSLLATSIACGLGYYFAKDSREEIHQNLSKVLLTASGLIYGAAFIEGLWSPTFEYLSNIVTPK
jgi:hypothetical protein